MARANNLTMCSFCGKSHAEVRKLIAGPGVYICDSCINVCKGILDKELNDDARRQSTTLRVPKPMEIRRQLDQFVHRLRHLAAVVICYLQYGSAHWMFTSLTIADFPAMRPPGWGFRLAIVYLIWMLLVLALYPLCRWFAGVKRRSSAAWLSYF